MKRPSPRAEPPGEAVPSAGTRLSAAEIHDNVLVAADEELRRPTGQLLWSGLDAGLTIGFSFIAGAYVATLAPEPLRAAAAAAVYPLGFVFVVLSRSQLFTENTLEPVVPVLARRDRKTLGHMLRLWGLVLPSNLLGCFLFGVAAAHTPMLGDELRGSLAHVAAAGTSGGFWAVGYRAIFGGWLVALMAWLVASTRATGAQILLIWLTTAPIAAFGFRHSIAGSVEAFYRAAAGDAGWLEMLTTFVVPALVGNTIGGVGLVALLNHAQVPAGDEAPSARA